MQHGVWSWGNLSKNRIPVPEGSDVHIAADDHIDPTGSIRQCPPHFSFRSFGERANTPKKTGISRSVFQRYCEGEGCHVHHLEIYQHARRWTKTITAFGQPYSSCSWVDTSIPWRHIEESPWTKMSSNKIRKNCHNKGLDLTAENIANDITEDRKKRTGSQEERKRSIIEKANMKLLKHRHHQAKENSKW